MAPYGPPTNGMNTNKYSSSSFYSSPPQTGGDNAGEIVSDSGGNELVKKSDKTDYLS